MPEIQNDQSGVSEYAGFWCRFSAATWDFIIINIPASLIGLIIVLVFGLGGYINFNAAGNIISISFSLVIIVFITCMEGVKGGSPGKLMLGLSIRNERGELIGIPRAILRCIGKILSVLTLGIGFLMIIWTEKKQGLHDKIAGTYVVRLPNKRRKGLEVTGIVLGVLILLILPILLSLAFMAYFGVFLPNNSLPQKCTLPAGFSCVDFQTGADGVTRLEIRNSIGMDLKEFTVSIENECLPKNIELKNGQINEFKCAGIARKKGQKYSHEIEIKYTNSESGVSHTAKGLISTKYI